jgi:hypothetical protein
MNHFSAIITGSSIVLAEVNDAGLTSWLIGEETRPGSFADADTFLAWHGYGRTEAWDLTGAGVVARVERVDNLFNGTRAARLDQAVGTTHGPWKLGLATSIQDGDLITDQEFSATYVVAGSAPQDGGMKIHMVGEGQVWDDRHTSVFHGGVLIARKR